MDLRYVPFVMSIETQHLRTGPTVSRRRFVRSGFTATLASVVSPLARSATWNSDTALLILDFQVGIGDQPYAKSAAQRAVAALKAGRAGGLPVVFSRVKFRAGYRDIADSNKAFALIKMKNLFSRSAKVLTVDQWIASLPAKR